MSWRSVFVVVCPLFCGLFGILVPSPLLGQWRDISEPDNQWDHRDISFVDEASGFLAGGITLPNGVEGWGIGRTTDGGESWMWQSGIDLKLTALRFHDLDHGFLAGGDPSCDCPIAVYTTTGGASWPNYSFEDLEGFFTSLVSADARHAFFAGGNVLTDEGYVARTTDGGESFSVIMRQEHSFVSQINQIDEKTLIIAVGSPNGGEGRLLKTVNADADPDGVEWTELYGVNDMGIILDLDFTDANNGYLLFSPSEELGISSEIYRTTNGGSQWERVYSSGTLLLTGLDFLNTDNGFAVGFTGVILQTTNGGKDWTETRSASELLLSEVEYINPDLAYAAGELGALLKYERPVSGVEGDNMENTAGEYVQWLSDGGKSGVLLVHQDSDLSSDSRLIVSDVLGNVVEEVSFAELRGDVVRVETSAWNPGVYFFILWDNRKVLERGTLVVR